MNNGVPKKQGLYDPAYEHDSCGVGFVCNVDGSRTNDIVAKGISVLERMSHRGAVGSDPKTGDGAGILMQIPHEFLKKVCDESKIIIPCSGKYGAGMVFLPTDRADREFCTNLFERIAIKEGLSVLGWRNVPVNDNMLGKGAKETQPVICQVLVGCGDEGWASPLDFERKLYIVRRQVEKYVRESAIKQKNIFYITGLSSRTLSYKGLLMPEQVRNYFVDLADTDMKSAMLLVHSRYSTNTFPTWDLAQPFRFLAHNGEINTVRGNINWFRARERLMSSPLFGTDIEKIKPVIVEGGSDSATLDNVFEILTLAGRPIEHVMMMLIPNAWHNDKNMDASVKEFYKYHACIMEPWDGPAAVAFTDGTNIGAVLDRNGLRPARYIVTKNGFVVMSSEAGVLDVPASDILRSGRLEPGKMFFIDTKEKRIIDDKEIKERVAKQAPYAEWNKKYSLSMSDLRRVSAVEDVSGNVLELMKNFGYTREDLKIILKPMAADGEEPIGSMGNDTPHAVLSKKCQMFYDYFKQLFAQVTNPPIDPIREEIVMSLDTYIGQGKNVLDETSEHCHKICVKSPILDNEELEAIRNININGFKTKTIYTHFKASCEEDLLNAIDRICFEAEFAVEKGFTFIILSDRGVNVGNAALPALLATGAVHQHLVRKTVRSQISILVESGEPREVNHFALLFGYGADCVNPYLAYEAVKHIVKEDGLGIDGETAVKNYKKAVSKGIMKILSKMGISTLQSYKGAQIFEALGLNGEVVDRCFTGTASRISGADFSVIAKETILRHNEAYAPAQANVPYLQTGGRYQWKKDGEFHLWNPESIAALQDAVRKNDYGLYKKFAALISDQSKNPTTLRSLLKSRQNASVPISEVEPVDEIVKRFVTGAMSFGSISKGAHESIAIAMNRLGGKSNTGEGGEDPVRFKTFLNGDSARSAIKQVASGRFGVTTNYLVNANELQIKIAQGAKPGEGGQLPGHKVSAIIAKTRYTTAGVTLISPPPHHDIYSIEDLAQLIFDLKNVNPRARISVKLVSEIGVGTIAAGVAKGHADMILISGGDGGTGASPRSSIMYAGLPWELGLSETHQTLVLNDLRGRVRLQTDGQMRTGRDVAMAALLGAEEYGFCSAVLVTLGCVMLRHCHLNNCSLGVATQDECLEKRFAGKPEYVVNYMRFVAQELREIMSELGVRTVHELVGRSELLEMNKEILPWKAEGLDYSRLLYKPQVSPDVCTRCATQQTHNIEHVLDREIIDKAKDALEKAEPVTLEFGIKNTDRTVGAMLSGGICRRYGEGVLPEDTIRCKFRGVAGQSFGAFLTKGITFEMEGLANDYVGKGMSGGKIMIYPDRSATYRSDENIII